jgi:hypothetical protein
MFITLLTTTNNASNLLPIPLTYQITLGLYFNIDVVCERNLTSFIVACIGAIHGVNSRKMAPAREETLVEVHPGNILRCYLHLCYWLLWKVRESTIINFQVNK